MAINSNEIGFSTPLLFTRVYIYDIESTKAQYKNNVVYLFHSKMDYSLIYKELNFSIATFLFQNFFKLIKYAFYKSEVFGYDFCDSLHLLLKCYFFVVGSY